MSFKDCCLKNDTPNEVGAQLLQTERSDRFQEALPGEFPKLPSNTTPYVKVSSQSKEVIHGSLSWTLYEIRKDRCDWHILRQWGEKYCLNHLPISSVFRGIKNIAFHQTERLDVDLVALITCSRSLQSDSSKILKHDILLSPSAANLFSLVTLCVED